MLHVGVIVDNPVRWLGHAEFWIAPSHAFHAHKAYALAVQVESAVSNFKLAYAKIYCEPVFVISIRDGTFEAVQMGMVKVPQLGLGQSGLEGERPDRLGFDRNRFSAMHLNSTSHCKCRFCGCL
jgi:hypothetical protein